MTRSDPGDHESGQGNPFDLGLPMLRTPARRGGKRKRPGRRAPRRREEPNGPAPEPLPIADESAYESGDWEQWLDSGPDDRRAALAPEDDEDHDPRERPRSHDYDPPDDLVDKSALVPTLIDRSGGNPGPRLRHPRRPRRDNRRGDKLIAAMVMIGLGVVVIAVLLTVIHTGKRAKPAATVTRPVPAHTSTPAASSAAPTSAAPAGSVAADGCEQRRTADIVSGTDPGGTGSGPDTILAFERAYYVQRSGFAARAVVADDAKVRTAEEIQRGINQIPVGTRYCVQITRAGDEGQWEVRLTQQKPDEQPQTFTQIITTKTIANRTLIADIAAG
ncbi:hypothetical protein ACFYTQ_19790 [Nocardia sp. NPDC004068]|uniref:hypothetical protein n=1 Tax=Nocardia sp. NPDC004068 TaxID=3364303 RepID=UPI0036CC0BE5